MFLILPFLLFGLGRSAPIDSGDLFIIDTDPGVDDAEAIAFATYALKGKILAFTVVPGEIFDVLVTCNGGIFAALGGSY